MTGLYEKIIDTMTKDTSLALYNKRVANSLFYRGKLVYETLSL